MWRYNPEDPDAYVGNIWGWKFSAFGAFLLIGLIVLALATAHRRGVSVWDAVRDTPMKFDSIPKHPHAPAPRPAPGTE